ncbi:MAG: hypothetical protein H6584_01670 [Flavobacteriales bacterium]|nr:hypothetical protein [Flavobacteriales bacterium]
MANKKESTASVEDKLRTLYNLQLIDSKIDEIKSVRGELPLEVQDLEDEVIGLTNRVNKLQDELKEIQDNIKVKKNAIDEHKEAIAKYTEQQNNVRNNREYNSITKEIEFQELEIQLAEKHIKEFKASVEHKKAVIEQSKEQLAQKQEHLDHKKAELDSILAETNKEESFLLEHSEKIKQDIEDRLLTAYTRIRSSMSNGLAVVSIDRGASAGSYFTIPPQVISEIAARKKIITDEHSGRILIDQELADEETQKINELLKDFAI